MARDTHSAIRVTWGLTFRRPQACKHECIRRASLETDLAAIHALRDHPDPAGALAPYLRHKSNHAVAAAVDIIKRLELAVLAPDLVEAFMRLMRDPAKLDPACKALNAIAETLVTLGESAPAAYLAGIRHIQKEGSFGPPIDVASKLRGLCARGLVRCGHPDALLEAVTLLADPEVPARVGAVQALADARSPAAELVLRLKALQGDHADVMSECFAALLGVAPGRSVEFVAKFLNASSPAVIEAAALALGESHSAQAFPLLQEAWGRHPRQALRKTILLAIALLRSDEAVAFLVMRRERDTGEAAADAEAALSLYHR